MSPVLVSEYMRCSFLYFYFYTVLHALAARRRATRNAPAPLSQTLRKAITSPTAPVLLGVPTELAVGFIAGVASRAVSTPLSVLTVRLQSSSNDDSDDDDEEVRKPAKKTDIATEKERPGLSDVARDIYSEQGLSGFWAGEPHTICAHILCRADANDHQDSHPLFRSVLIRRSPCYSSSSYGVFVSPSPITARQQAICVRSSMAHLPTHSR